MKQKILHNISPLNNPKVGFGINGNVLTVPLTNGELVSFSTIVNNKL